MSALPATAASFADKVARKIDQVIYDHAEILALAIVALTLLSFGKSAMGAML